LVSTYPNTFTAAQALSLYQSYMKYPVSRIDDSGLITVAEPASPVLLYSYNWDSGSV
jgi:hypothetical protein